MARAAFQVIKKSAEEGTGKKTTGEEYCYIDYARDPEIGPAHPPRAAGVPPGPVPLPPASTTPPPAA